MPPYEPIRLIDEGKLCPKPTCQKPEYTTRRAAGKTLSICPNGHSWDAEEIREKKAKEREASAHEYVDEVPHGRVTSWDYVRRRRVFRSDDDDPPLLSGHERSRDGWDFGAIATLTTIAPHIKMIGTFEPHMRRETYRRFLLNGGGRFEKLPERSDLVLLGIPIVFDETVPLGTISWRLKNDVRNG